MFIFTGECGYKMKRRSTAIIAVINIIIVFAVLPVFVSSAAGYYPSATPEFFVNDFAEVLSSDTRENIVLREKARIPTAGLWS